MHSKHCAITVATVAALAGLSASATAQTAVTPRPPVVVTPSPSVAVTPTPTAVVAEKEAVRPNIPLLAGGTLVLAVGYAPAVITGIISDHKGDDKLFIPVVGPWLDMGERGCDTGEVFNCGSSGIETAALIVDGAVQGIGALAMVGSLFIPEHKTVVRAARADTDRPRIQVAPTSMGGHGYGLIAAGTF